MPDARIIYKIFISSPSDLREEREKIKEKIEEIEIDNKIFRCIMWENDLPSVRTDDVQREIDQQLLRDSNIVVGIFRDRFGSRTSRYPSGTVGEIKDAIDMKKPVILYFLNSTLDLKKASAEALNELSKIIQFKEEYKDKGIYYECENIDKAISHLRLDLSANLNLINPHPYNQFISALYERLSKIKRDVTKYETILLTIPDSQFVWNDDYNDISKHFLDEKKNDIQQDQTDILSVIIDNDRNHFVKRAYFSFIEPYTYRYFDYFFKMFKNITNIHVESIAYEKILDILISLCKDPIIKNIIDVSEMDSFLTSMQNCNIDKKMFEYVSICFNKLAAAIILMDLVGKFPNYLTLRPLVYYINDEFKCKYARLKESIGEVWDYESKITYYIQLYNLLYNQQKEIIDYVAGELALDFFSVVNDKKIQDNIIFTSLMTYTKISGLYSLFYENVKYKLYRNYNGINEYNGFMRYDLIDRYIALEYNEKRKINYDVEHKFEHIKPDQSVGNFVIRQANINDINNIKRLNNPLPPYRRAIYVKSDDNEIESAINNKEIWIIEECITDEIFGHEKRNIACVAVILDCNNEHSDFNTDSLTKEFEEKYCKVVNRNFSYLDFDSVLTNDGRSNIGNRSYRGCGFQRLMLIFAEILAYEKNCDYICATVSSFNKPSMRNFILNGYHFVEEKKYTLDDGVSPYYAYITSDAATQKEKDDYSSKIEYECEKYGGTFERLSIDRDNYTKDKDVPRNFVVLNINDNAVNLKQNIAEGRVFQQV